MDIKNVDLFFCDNPNPMLVFDPADLSIQEVNKSALELYGYSRQEMLSLTIEELHPQDEVSTLKDYLAGDLERYDNAGI